MFNVFGSDKKSSKTTTNTSYENTDRSANAGGTGSIAASDGSTVQIQTSDPAIVGKALETTAGVSLASLKFLTDTQQAVLDYAKKSGEATSGSVERVAQLASSSIAESRKDPDNDTMQKVAAYAAAVVAVVAISWAFKSTK